MNEIFSIFNPDWWMDENNNALQITDAILFLFLCLPVLYLFICALFSLGKYKNPYPPAKEKLFNPLIIFWILNSIHEISMT